MRPVWFVATLLLVQAVCYGRDSAYQALRTAGGKDQSLLNRVIEVQGAKGDPQPVVWRIVVDDPNARGGVRVLEVSKGRVVSEHTPIRAYAGTGANAVMDFKRLNLDSSSAFTIANQEATKRHAGFDSVDYELRGDAETGAPVWILKLADASGANIGTVHIAADTGAVLRAEGFRNEPRRDADASRDDSSRNPGAGDSDSADDGDLPREKRIGYKINKGIHQVGATLQEFFTGNRTIDRNFRDDR